MINEVTARAIRSVIVNDQLVAEQSEPVRYRQGNGLLSLRGGNELHPLFSGDLDDWDAMAPSVSPSGGFFQISPAQNISESEDFEHVDWTASNITFNTVDTRRGPDNVSGSATLVEATSTTGTLTISPSGTDEEARSLFIKDASDAVVEFAMPGGAILADPVSPWIRITSVGSSRWARYSYDGVLIDASDPPPNEILVTDEYINGWFRVGFSSPASSGDYQIEIAEGFAYIFGANASTVPVSGGRLPRYTKDNEDWATTTLQPADGIDSARLVYSSVKLDDEIDGTPVPEYDPSTTYGEGDYAYKGKYIYRSTDTGNVGNDPEEEQQKPAEERLWIRWATMNRWRAFDQLSGLDNATTANGFLQFIVQSAQVISDMALLGLRGSSAKIEVMDENFDIVYSNEIDLISNSGVISPWHYHFFPVQTIDTAVDSELPGIPGAYIMVTIEGEGTVSCGKCVFGIADGLGATLSNPTIGFEEFSEFRQSGSVGFIEEVSWVPTFSGDVIVDSSIAANIRNTLAQYRGNPTVFIFDKDKPIGTLWGTVRSFNMVVPAGEGDGEGTIATYSLDIVGFTS